MRFELLRILIVDDNPHMRMLITEILRAIGISDISEASDGSSAAAVLRTRSIDIVLSDLAMKPLDGIAFMRWLRNSLDSPTPLVPVIMITGHSTSARVTEARDVGVNEILSKPITAAGVLDRITRVVERPRSFVRATNYFGPDRRRRSAQSYTGPRRRKTDLPFSG